jgi:hypothetical protein
MRTHLLTVIILFLIITTVRVRPVYAAAYSIPVVGSWSTHQIGLNIPTTPVWARAIILDAARAWNLAQLWFEQYYFPGGSVFTFAVSPLGNVTITYGIPAAFASIAVGWTQYTFGSGTTIVAAHVYLEENTFNSQQEPNTTDREYGFRLALHELGRVLGLGSLIDGLDVMDPLGTVSRSGEPPMISFIDLFALHILASEPFVATPVIVLNTDQAALLNAWNLLGASFFLLASTGYDYPEVTCPAKLSKGVVCYW